jgi:FKBP-type peptidyl-prolyl cis-trans isomerase FkpA
MRATMAGVLLALSIGAAPAGADVPVEVVATDRVIGDGAEIRRGWFAIMHYTGWVYDDAAPEHKGMQFVDSQARGQPSTFVYGYQRALIGLEKGMRGMKVGGKRTIVVPARFGYDGFKYRTPKEVPPGSALVFDVELLDIVPENSN